ncbi:putative phage repressor [Roseibium sp. TrichSKD4]|uniref:hypothetical protein n=1 Tax=Roseibium sp. TrichSKD4 TaxID=744980 RepID=UPI0001E56B4C|nr:hypothetical protein [Roseibium sp. TrichSKD4]EFO30120.1 putative phage repressor [Roseibium sp. TrichSKD4]
MEDKELFNAWVASLGFNERELRSAGELLGFDKNQIYAVRAGKRPLKKAEKLAMAAVKAELAEWAPEHDKNLLALGLLKETLFDKGSDKTEAA